MHFEKASPELLALFDAVAPVGPPAERRKMFGYPCFFVRGNLTGGLHENNFLLRLSVDDRALLIAAGGKVFEPMTGRQMKEYVVVPPAILQDKLELNVWIGKALTYALSLPEKMTKKKSS